MAAARKAAKQSKTHFYQNVLFFFTFLYQVSLTYDSYRETNEVPQSFILKWFECLFGCSVPTLWNTDVFGHIFLQSLGVQVCLLMCSFNIMHLLSANKELASHDLKKKKKLKKKNYSWLEEKNCRYVKLLFCYSLSNHINILLTRSQLKSFGQSTPYMTIGPLR